MKKELTPDEKCKMIIKTLGELQTALDDLPNATEKLIFGEDLRRAIALVNDRKLYRPDLWGLPPRESGREMALRCARENLDKQKKLLADMKRMGRQSFTLAEGVPITPDEASLERQEWMVKSAQRQLDQLLGREDQIKAEREKAAKADHEAALAELKASGSAWRSGWREYSDKQRGKDDGG